MRGTLFVCGRGTARIVLSVVCHSTCPYKASPSKKGSLRSSCTPAIVLLRTFQGYCNVVKYPRLPPCSLVVVHTCTPPSVGSPVQIAYQEPQSVLQCVQLTYNTITSSDESCFQFQFHSFSKAASTTLSRDTDSLCRRKDLVDGLPLDAIGEFLENAFLFLEQLEFEERTIRML